MANSDGPDAALTPEERLADRLALERQLTPPFDIEQLARDFADLERDAIPADCDAVVLGLHGGRPRPLIVLNRSRPERRQRFSLAHEIGHIAIPWHIGTIACHTVLDLSGYGDYYYRRGEAEANRFAATLLLPSDWVRLEGATKFDLRTRLEALWQTGVSAPVACLRLVRFLEPGALFVLADPSGQVELSAVSPGTRLKALTKGSLLRRELLDPVSADQQAIWLGNRQTLWWLFGERVDLTASEDERSSPEILDALLARHFPAAERDAKRRRIAGIVGYAKGQAETASPDELHAVLRTRFAAREDLASLVADSDFALYLSRRASELVNEAD